MKRIIKILMVIVLIGVVAYCGMCVYGNYFGPDAVPSYDMPSKVDASYSLVVKNTATVILTNDVEAFGDEVGTRVFYLHGYWELIGREFKYRDSTLVLSEQTFGEIELKRRVDR